MGLLLAAAVCGPLVVQVAIGPRSGGGVKCGEFVAGDGCDPDTNDKTLSATDDPAVCRAQCEAQGGSGCCYFRPPNSTAPQECQWNAGGSPSHVGGPTIRSATKCTGPAPLPPLPTLAPHEQLHIAFGDTDDSLVVTWASLCYPCNHSAVLHWGLITDSGTTVPQRRTIPANTTQGGTTSPRVSVHHVILTGLQAGAQYSYSVAWAHHPMMESEPRVVTSKRPGVNTSVRLAMFGDLGYTNDQVTRFLRDESVARTIDAIICYGDMVYWWHPAAAAGEPGSGDQFFRAVQNMSAGVIPFHVSPGNGDFPGNFSEYRHRWIMPGYTESESLWHSFDLGRMHMIGISSEAMGYYSGNEGGSWKAMLAWLKADLAKATRPEARALRPWIVVHQHRPSFSTDGAELFGVERANYLILEKLLYESGVDMVFAGHVHNMERTWPLYSNGSRVMGANLVRNGTTVPGDPYANAQAPVYIVSGAVGNAEEHDNIANEWQHWDAWRSLAYGYSHLEVHNETHMTVDFQSDNLGGQIIDAVTLSKDRPCGFGNCSSANNKFAQPGAADPAFEQTRNRARVQVQGKWAAAAAAGAAGAGGSSMLGSSQRRALEELFATTDGLSWQKRWPASASELQSSTSSSHPCGGQGGGSPARPQSGLPPVVSSPYAWYGVGCLAMTDTTMPSLHPASAAGGVTALQLPSNGLRGVIPNSLGTALAPSLQLLDLSDNFLSGTVPPSIFSMPLLHTLYLMGRGAVDAGGNSIAGGGPRLGGVIPRWELPSLKYLGFSRNAISGSIPQTIGESSNLKEMWACSNQFSGIIPEGVTKLPLHAFYVADNHFSCPLPCFHKNAPYAQLDCDKCVNRTPSCYPCAL